MFFVDDILLSPFKSLMWICRELQKTVDQEYTNERQRLTDELSKAYMMLETGQIGDSEFEKLEDEILDRLDALKGAEEDGAEETAVAHEDG